MDTNKLTSSDLRSALDIREQIDTLETQLIDVLSPAPRINGRHTASETVALEQEPRSKRRRMSPQARKRIALAQRARWAKHRAEMAR